MMDKAYQNIPPLGEDRRGLQINLSLKTLHFKKPARTSRGEYTEHQMIVITMMDEKGKKFGMGECAPLPDLSCDRDAYTRMSDVADLINKALASDDYAEFLRPYPALLFALESAMYDYQKNPLLYDTPFARSEVGIPFNGLVWMSDYDDMLSQVKKKILQGFRCIKIKIGAIEWDEEIRLIEKIRSRFSKDTIQLRVDANGRLSPTLPGGREKYELDKSKWEQSIIDRMKQLAKYDIHSIEQPIMPGDWKFLAELCKQFAPSLQGGQGESLPIALDEELIGLNQLHEKQTMLDTVKPQYIVVKPSLHGGMSGSIEWISEAQKRGIGSWITSALESNIGLRNVAFLAARVYGTTPDGRPQNMMPQGLGTGQLFTDNIEMDIEMRGSKIWRCEVDE